MKKKKQAGKRKYKVVFKQEETFIVDVYARSEEVAKHLAEGKWYEGDYQEAGDCVVGIDNVYDVTNTDDPFHP